MSADEEKPVDPPAAPAAEDHRDEAPASDRVRRKPNFEALEPGEQTESTWPGLQVRSAANVPPLRRWAFLAIPAIALVEVALHLRQTGPLVPEESWRAVAQEARREKRADDAILFAPTWWAPVGRMHLAGIVTVEEQARADLSRYPRALEIAYGGEENPEVAGWPIQADKISGKLHLRVRTNPRHEPVVDDLLAKADAGRVAVTVSGGPSPAPRVCPFTAGVRGRMRDGRDGWGTYIAAHHYTCPSADVPSPLGVAVMADNGYAPRRCLLVPTPLGGRTVELRFEDVRFAKTIVAHHAIHAQSENLDRHGAPVELSFAVEGETPDGAVTRKILGADTHKDGERWKEFRVDTAPLAGQTGDLIVTVHSAQGDRPYCFEATTR